MTKNDIKGWVSFDEPEIYQGNTFNRDNTLYSYTTATASAADALSSMAKTSNVVTDTIGEFCSTVATKDYVGLATVAIQSDVDTLARQFEKMQERIDQLEKSYVKEGKLRGQLKTLQYKSELD